MKTHLLSIFVAIVAFAAAQQTSAQTLGTANNDQPVSPKPSFKIEYSVPLTIKSNNKTLDKDNIQNGDYLYKRKYDLHDEATLTLKSNPTVAIMLAGVEIDVDEEMSLVEGEYIADEPQKKVEEYKEGDVAGEVVEITDNSSTQVWAVDPENDTKRTRTVTYTRTTTVTEINEQMTETTVTVTVEAKDVIQNVTHHNTTLTFITHDLYSLEPGETYTLTMPLFNDQVTADQFDYTVMDCEVVSVDTEFNTDEVINEPLIVKEGAELEISGNVTVNNKLIVLGPTSGIRIHEGGSLTVADTAYFIGPKDWQSLDFPWLINKGTFDNGDRTIFTRSVEHGNIHTEYQFYPISLPIVETKLKKLCTFFEYYTYGCIASHNNPSGGFWLDFEGEELVSFDSNTDKGLFFKTFSETGNNNAAIRFVGQIVDESSHIEDASVFEVKDSDRKDSYGSTNSIDNVYQAPINIRGLVESGNANNINSMEVAIGRHNKYISYNVFSGITTYDGPMQYGYLLPHMTHLRAPADVDTRMEYGKDDLTTYEEIVDKYPVATTYPYIRFFVEDIKEESVYFGNRDVCAVYFIPKEEYEARQLSSFHSIDYEYETLAFTPFARFSSGDFITTRDGLMQYPFISTNTPKEGTSALKERWGMKIKVLPLPETEEDIAEVSLFIRTKNALDKVSYGVLDSYLPNIDFFFYSGEVEDKISTNYTNSFLMPNDAPTADFLNLNRSHYKTIDFRFKKHKETGSQSGVSSSSVEDGLIVYASDGSIILEGAEIGSLIELHDLSGAVVARQNVDSESESLQVSEKGVYFVSVCTSNAKYNRKVMVK